MKNIKDYSAVDGAICDTAFANAFAAAPTFGAIFIPAGTFRITKPLVVPVFVSIYGEGARSVIQADYSVWTGGSDYRALVPATREAVNYYGYEYNQVFKDFSIHAQYSANGAVDIDNSSLNVTIKATGIEVASTNSMTVGQAPLFGLVHAKFENIFLNKFDTAIRLKECWESDFRGISGEFCKSGIVIAGKTVNVSFMDCKFATFTTRYSSDHSNPSAPTIGISIDSGFHYTDGEGRPEGIIFGSGCLIFGATNNVVVSRCFSFRMHQAILDGGTSDCVVIGNPDNVSIVSCYLYSVGDVKLIRLDPVSNSASRILIQDNHFVSVLSYTVNQQPVDYANYGIYYFGNGSIRGGVNIENNFFTGLNFPMAFNYLNKSRIINNYGKGNGVDAVAPYSKPFIYIQSDGADNIVDGNYSDDNNPILGLHPTTSASLKIGVNKSPISSTYFAGYVTLPAHSNNVNAPNGMYTIEMYYRVITIPVPEQPLVGVSVQNQVSPPTSMARITVGGTIDSPTRIYYEAKAIPYSAVQ